MDKQSQFRFDHKMNYDFQPPPYGHAELDATLDEIIRAQLVRLLDEPELAYIFKHALVQDTAYSTLLKQERHRLHYRVALSLERAYPTQTDALAATLAEHFWLSEAWERAVEYALRAGAGALRVFALREALGHFERALAALERLSAPSVIQHYDALMGWAEAAFKFKPYPEQLAQLARAEQIAREQNDKPRLARALYKIGRVHSAQGHSLRAIPPLAECFTLARELGDERFNVIPTHFMGVATVDTNPRQAIALFDEAIALAQKYDDPDIEATTWAIKAMTHARLGEFSEAHAALARGQILVEKVKSPMTVSDVYLFAGWTFLDMGNLEQGLEFGQRSADTAVAADNMDCMCYAYACVGFNRLAGQQLAQATDAFQEAIHRSQFSGADLFENLGRAGLAMAQFFSGRTEALADLEDAYAQAQALHNNMGSALIAQTLGGIYALQGNAARAESILNAALAYFRPNQMAPYLARTLETLAQVYDQQARPNDAAQARAEGQHWQQTISLAVTEKAA